MKFMMVSKCGEGAQVLYQIKEEGNDVSLFIKEPGYKRCWDGLLPKAASPYENADVYIFDMSGMGDIAANLRSRNKLVLGAGPFSDKIEHDRKFGTDLMNKCGIKTPKVYEFKGKQLDDAIKFVSTQTAHDKLVFKPSGDGLPTRLTYCACDNDDLVHYLEYIKQHYEKEIEEFVLQEFIEGTLVSSEYWCNGKEFLRPVNHTVECKKLMNDDKGPSTGCSGNAVWLCSDSCLIVEEGILKAEDICSELGYVGPIDLNAIVNDTGVYGLEWTPRFGYDALPTMLQLMDQEVGEFMYDCASGKDMDMPLVDACAAGVRISIPPYPIEPEDPKDIDRVGPNFGIPIGGVLNKYRDNYYFFEIMKNGKGLVHADGTGVIACVSDYADTVMKALEMPYNILDEMKIPDKQYRTDLSIVLDSMYSEVLEAENA